MGKYNGFLRADDRVMVAAEPDALFKLVTFVEERMADWLRMGVKMGPAELHELLGTLYAIKEAALRLQPGERVEPPWRSPEWKEPEWTEDDKRRRQKWLKYNEILEKGRWGTGELGQEMSEAQRFVEETKQMAGTLDAVPCEKSEAQRLWEESEKHI